MRVEADLQVMGMLANRRDELGRARTQVSNRLHRLLLKIVPGGANKYLSAMQARALVATVRLRDPVGRTRWLVIVELIGELDGIDRKIKAVDKELKGPGARQRIHADGPARCGPAGAARLLCDVGDIHRFAGRDRFA